MKGSPKGVIRDLYCVTACLWVGVTSSEQRPVLCDCACLQVGVKGSPKGMIRDLYCVTVLVCRWVSPCEQRPVLCDCACCLQVGVKGNPKGVNRGLDCDVIVAEVSWFGFDAPGKARCKISLFSSSPLGKL